jgi:predicted ester cyclase
VTTAEQHEAMIRQVVARAWNAGDLAVVDELFAPDCVDRAPGPGLTPDRAGYKAGVARWRAAFPDLVFTIDELFADGDQVALRFTVRGTHRGSFGDLAPTGRAVAVSGMALGRFRDGRLVERWGVWDTTALDGRRR